MLFFYSISIKLILEKILLKLCFFYKLHVFSQKQKSKSKTARVEKRFKWWKENKKKKENLSKTNVESSNTNQEHNDEGCQDTYNTKAHLHKNPKTSEKLGNILTKTDNVENTIKSPKNKMKKSLNNTTNTTKNTNNVDEKLPQTQPTLSDPTSNTISNKTKKQKLSKRQYVVFVGKLTKDTNSNDISKHFEPCGQWMLFLNHHKVLLSFL